LEDQVLSEKRTQSANRQSSIVNHYVREGGRPGFFWRPFCAVSGVLLVLLVLFAVTLLTFVKN
jgi:hypothetical protein